MGRPLLSYVNWNFFGLASDVKFKKFEIHLIWRLFFVLFLQAWVLLATYLDVYALPVVVLTFAFNLVSLVLVQKTVKVDPLLSAALSLVFPVTFMKSIYQAEQVKTIFN